jgi:hypothetical protein
LAAMVLPVQAAELGFADPRASHRQASLGPVESLTASILAGRIEVIEHAYLNGIQESIDEIRRLRGDARRRNDSVAAACVEQRLRPAQNLGEAASGAAKRLRGLSASEIEALNAEATTLTSAAERVAELAEQARRCLRINSGQVVSQMNLTPEIEPEEVRAEQSEQPFDAILPRKPAATPVR